MSQPNLDIDLVVVEDALEAQALRCALEAWNCRVRVQWIGITTDLVRILGGKELLAENIVLHCHGIDQGLALPELDSSLEKDQPYHGALSPAELREFLRLPDRFVLNTGCGLGTADFAEPFLRAGCKAYIGAMGYPQGSASLFYVLHFFYAFACQRRTIPAAHEAARSHDINTEMFRLFQRKPESPAAASR
jgi:hypothetical protein